MTFFFLVVGLEAKRELDLGELRERRRLAIPVLAALGGMLVPVAIYLAFNAGGPGAHGWGAAMSTDTAFALRRARRCSPRARRTRLRVFLLTLAVVDDLCRADRDRDRLHGARLDAGARGRGRPVRAARRAALRAGRRDASCADRCGDRRCGSRCSSRASTRSISGLAVGLATSAYPPSREDLERATELARSFREQPTPELARSAQRGVLSAISPNERLQYSLHPWTSYVIVPLFALANAGIHVTGGLLGDAIGSPITLGILIGYVVGKPIGRPAGVVAGHPPSAARPAPAAQLARRWSAAARRRHRLHGLAADLEPCLPRRAPRGGEARRARLGDPRAARRLGGASASCDACPTQLRARQIVGTADDILDLADDVDPARDHIRGPTTLRSRSSSTATSSAPTAARPSRSSASCSPTSATSSATSGATCRSTTCTPTRSSPPRHPRQPPPRASSGRCTTCCWATRTR